MTEPVRRVLDTALAVARAAAAADVDRLRRRHPRMSDDELARRAVNRAVLRVAAVSAATGVGGLPMVPLNATAVLAAQVGVVAAVAHVYGRLHDPQLATDVAVLLAGDDAVSAALGGDVPPSGGVSRRWVRQNLTRSAARELYRAVARRVGASGGGPGGRLLRLTPLLGAVTGSAVDRKAARALGERAIRYYTGRSSPGRRGFAPR